MNEHEWSSRKRTEREVLVAAYDPKARTGLRGLIKDGEQHWVGGTVNYFRGTSGPDEDELQE